MSHLTHLLFLGLTAVAVFSNPHHHHDSQSQSQPQVKGKSPFEESEIVPDVLDTVPKDRIQVTYGTMSVEMGNMLTPTQVKEAPTLIKWPADPQKLHTLVFVDPDAPNRRTHMLREFRHWLVVNIPGDDISKGETCSDYKGSGPPKGGGVHRYVYAVFEQAGKLNVDSKLCQQTGLERARFSTKHFVSHYKLGQLVAANYFNSQFEES